MAYNFTVITNGLASHLAGYPHQLLVDPEVSWWQKPSSYATFDVNINNVIDHPQRWFVSNYWVPLWLYIAFVGVGGFLIFWWLIGYHCWALQKRRCCNRNDTDGCFTYWLEKKGRRTRSQIKEDKSCIWRVLYPTTLLSLTLIIGTGAILSLVYTIFLQSDWASFLTTADNARIYTDGIKTRAHAGFAQFPPEIAIAKGLYDHCENDGCPAALQVKLQTALTNYIQTQEFLNESFVWIDDKIGYDTSQFSNPARYWFNQTFIMRYVNVGLLILFTCGLWMVTYPTCGSDKDKVMQHVQDLIIWLVFFWWIIQMTVISLPTHGMVVGEGSVCTTNPYTVGQRFKLERYINDYVWCTPGVTSGVTTRLVEARTDLSLGVEAAEDLLTFENARKGSASGTTEDDRITARYNATQLQVLTNQTLLFTNQTNDYLLCTTPHNLGVDLLNRICYNGLMHEGFILTVSDYVGFAALWLLIFLLPVQPWPTPEERLSDTTKDLPTSTPMNIVASSSGDPDCGDATGPASERRRLLFTRY